MENALTLNPGDSDSVAFVRQRAEREHRTLDSIDEELVRCEKIAAEADAKPLSLAVGPELVGIEARILRDEEFERRCQSFAALTSLTRAQRPGRTRRPTSPDRRIHLVGFSRTGLAGHARPTARRIGDPCGGAWP